MQKENRRFEVEIIDDALGGDGVGRLPDGEVVLVPGCLKGERVLVEIVKCYRNYIRAESVQILSTSSDRRSPECLVCESCGGCQFQHVKYERQLVMKKHQFVAALQRIGGIEAIPEPIPVVPSPKQFNYRNKLTLHAKKQVGYGFFQNDNKTLLAIDSCPLAAEEINERIAEIVKRPGSLKNLNSRNPHDLTIRRLRNGRTQYFLGKGKASTSIVEEEFLGKPVRVPLTGFWQVNPPVAEQLVLTCRSWIEDCSLEFFIDAYTGVGLFSFAAGGFVEDGLCIEYDAKSIALAEQNHRTWNAGQRSFLTGAAEELLPNELQKLSRRTLDKTCLLLDPPRIGCKPKLFEQFQNHPPFCIIYVSCNPATLARDLKLLLACGYQVNKTAVFDMFPQTAHFESAVLLTR